MNFSQSLWIGNESECHSFLLKDVSLQYSSSDLFDGILVATAVIILAACPFTILLNALVMIAVKTKRRLQTHPNILLACLALTDLMVGLVLQPLNTAMIILTLQGKNARELCDIHLVSTVFLLMFTFATNCHLVLISGERYLAIKHTFTHASVVTKVRVMFCSAMAWIAAAFYLVILPYSRVMAFVLQASTVSSITLFQILVYKEARRHEKQILAQHVSVETRAKFKREKKALKLTTIILGTIFICFFIPFVSMFVVWYFFGATLLRPDVETVVRHLGLVPVMMNSVANPVIYTVQCK